MAAGSTPPPPPLPTPWPAYPPMVWYVPPKPAPSAMATIGLIAAILFVFIGPILLFAGVGVFVCPVGLCRTIGPPEAPLGSYLAFGNITSETVVAGAPARAGCAAPTAGIDYCEVVRIANASGGITTASVEFGMQTPTGNDFPPTSAVLLDAAGDGIAIFTGQSGGGSWAACTLASCHVANLSSTPETIPAPLSLADSIVVQVSSQTGGTSPSGDWFEAYGVGSYSGSIGIACP